MVQNFSQAIKAVAADPENYNRVYVLLNSTSQIFGSWDAGKTWTNIIGSLSQDLL